MPGYAPRSPKEPTVKNFTHRLRAFAAGRPDQPRAEIPPVTVEGTTAVMRLYDPVDSWGEYWGVSAKEFVTALDDLPDNIEEIRLHINSPGGEVWDGIALLNALRSHQARVVAVVDGIAASAASFIACGADEVVMARNSQMMIHDAWGLCVGNAEDMRELADMLDKISDNIASIYAEKAGGDPADWRAVMSRETWYSAEEAVAAGLADRVDEKADDAAAQNRFDLSIFKYEGRAQAPEPHAAVTPPADPANATDPADLAPAEAAAEEDRERQAQRVRAWQMTA